MRKYLCKISRTSLVCIILTGFMLLLVSCAKGDMLLFATADDCESAPISSWTVSAPHAVILQKASAKKQKTATDTLKKAGISDVKFLDFPAVKTANRSEKTLEKKWATAANTAKVASLLRQWKDDCIVFYASGEEDQRFLSSFADRCAGGANDPSCRKKKKQADEYLYEVTRLIDGVTNEERAAAPADESWRSTWEKKNGSRPVRPAGNRRRRFSSGRRKRSYPVRQQKGTVDLPFTDAADRDYQKQGGKLQLV